MSEDDPTPKLSWPRTVVGYFLDRFGRGAEPQAGRPLTRLAYGIYLTTASHSVELFPAGELDVFRLYQRHHASFNHDYEYITCRPEGAGPDEHLAYAVFKLTPEEELPIVDLNDLERRLVFDYGSFARLPRSHTLLEQRYGEDLNDGDPPEGPNRIVAPDEPDSSGFSVKEMLSILRAELTGYELVSWLEGAFRQRPEHGEVEHRYYLDRNGRVYLVRDHPREGKTLYRSETSPEALHPDR